MINITDVDTMQIIIFFIIVYFSGFVSGYIVNLFQNKIKK